MAYHARQAPLDVEDILVPHGGPLLPSLKPSRVVGEVMEFGDTRRDL